MGTVGQATGFVDEFQHWKTQYVRKKPNDSTFFAGIDERHFLFYSTVISSAEREAAYVIDGLLHNDVIKSDIHSTDTHGYTENNFGAFAMLVFGLVEFALLQRILYVPMRDKYERAKVTGSQGLDPAVFWTALRFFNFIVLPALGFLFGDLVLRNFIG